MIFILGKCISNIKEKKTTTTLGFYYITAPERLILTSYIHWIQKSPGRC